jgi:release factor glutamine methyltransferase
MLSNRIRKYFSYIAFHLYAQPKITTTDHVVIAGLRLTVPPTVFHPTLYFSTAILATYVGRLDLQGTSFLDRGCGSGILGLIAASKGASVVSIDRNPEAVRATARNAEANGLLSCVRVLEGDLFSPLGPHERFETIVFNPPFYPKEPQTPASYAWDAGVGYRVIKCFCAESRHRLAQGGQLILIASSDMDLAAINEAFAEARYQLETVELRRRLFEQFSVLRATQMP